MDDVTLSEEQTSLREALVVSRDAGVIVVKQHETRWRDSNTAALAFQECEMPVATRQVKQPAAA